MNIRIIAGRYGGRKINAPPRSSTHAMSERARAALFNILGSTVENARVLDAFAGSGSLGIEALSRGAREAVLVERDRVAARIIRENLDLLGSGGDIIATTVNNWLTTAEIEPFDLIFADPPYHDTQYQAVKKLLGLLKPGALMVLSHPGKGEVPSVSGVVVVDNRSYGNLNFTLYRREDA